MLRNRHSARCVRYLLSVSRYVGRTRSTSPLASVCTPCSFPLATSYDCSQSGLTSRYRPFLRWTTTSSRKCECRQYAGVLTPDPVRFRSALDHRPNEDFLLLLSTREMEGDTVFLRRNVSGPVAPCTIRRVDADVSFLVFFKWPVTGIIVQFVGFVGLFG